MSMDRYVKWQSDYGLAYADIPSGYDRSAIWGAIPGVGLVSIGISDNALVDVSKEEFMSHVDKWRASMDECLAKSKDEYDLVPELVGGEWLFVRKLK